MLKEIHPVVLTQDIDHFWDAYDHLKNCKDFRDSANCLKTRYFEQGTGGLHEFLGKYSYTPQDYIESISRHPRFYNSIRNNTLEAKSVEGRITLFYSKLRTYFPGYKPLTICFVISPLQSGGTTTGHYLLIGTEIMASTKEADLSEFGTGAWSKILAFNTNVPDNLLFVVAHETIHELQVNADFNNYELLNKSLNEGSADFLAALFTGVTANQYLYDYGNTHEQDLWKKFKAALGNHESADNWMNNMDRVGEGVPADLGYYIGSRIVACYYENSADKKQAILDIVRMKSPEDFLKKSGYGEKY